MSDPGRGARGGALAVNEPRVGRIVLALRRTDVVALVLIGAIYLLAAKLGLDRLWRVRVWEDPTLYVDYRGPDA